MVRALSAKPPEAVAPWLLVERAARSQSFQAEPEVQAQEKFEALLPAAAMV